MGVVGTGKMGSAWVRGLLHAGLAVPEGIVACDPDPGVLARLQTETGIRAAADGAEVLASAEIILLAVKPSVVRPVLQGLKVHFREEHLLLSIAAGIRIDAIREVVGQRARIIRVMPNTPALIGQGVSVFSAGAGVTEEDKQDVRAMLEAMGLAMEMPENNLDAVTGLSGSGPAFIFMVIEALAEGGVKMGLSHDKAMRLAAQTVAGAARMVGETGKSPQELREQVSSPGGTTMAGISVLEKAGLRDALIKAVEAATLRSIELGKEK